MKMNNLTHLGLAFLRISFSATMMVHGYDKLNRLFADEITFADPIGIGQTPSLVLAIIGEFVAPILIILGFKTRYAAIPAIITMLVAALIVHGADPFANKEMALLYAFAFISIGLLGPGKYSIDGK